MPDKEGESRIARWRARVREYPRDAVAWSELGYVLEGHRDHDGAIEAYHKALAIDPKQALVWNRLGVALYGKGDHDGAIDAGNKASAIDPGYANPRAHRGRARLGKGAVHGALASIDEAIRLDPAYARAYWYRGQALAARGDTAGARDALKRALSLDGTLVEARRMLESIKAEDQAREPPAIDPSSVPACVVCKTPVVGTVYNCGCGAMYHVWCARALETNGEGCWSCKQPFVALPEEPRSSKPSGTHGHRR